MIRYRKNAVKVKKTDGTIEELGAIGEGKSTQDLTDELDDVKNDLEELETTVEGKASAESVQNISDDVEDLQNISVATFDYSTVTWNELNEAYEAGKFLVLKVSNGYYSLRYKHTDENFYFQSAYFNMLYTAIVYKDGRKSAFGKTFTDNTTLPTKVKDIMSSTTDPEWTDAEKLSARQRLGMDKEWVLKGEIVGNEDDRGNIDTGVTVDFSGCTEFAIVGVSTATGNCWLATNIGNLLYAFARSGTMKRFASYKSNGMFIYPVINGYTTNVSGNVVANADLGNANAYNTDVVSDINTFRFATPNVVTSCNVKFYAR